MRSVFGSESARGAMQIVAPQLAEARRRADAAQLWAEAARCYRLAHGGAGPLLSSELEAIGAAFEREARELGDDRE